MATYVVANGAKYPVPRTRNRTVNVFSMFTPTTLNTGDVYKFCYLPAGAFICDIILRSGAQDVGGALLMNIGDTVNGSGSLIASAGSSWRNGGVQPAAGVVPGCRYYTADDCVQLNVGTGATGTTFTAINIGVTYMLDIDCTMLY